MSDVSVSQKRVCTVPNFISLTRILFVPLFCWMLFISKDRWGAALLWGALGATDWVDGWWARRFNAVSELGKLLDPLADRVILIVGVASVGVDAAVPWWLVVATLVREVSIAVASVLLYAQGVQRIDVLWWGKCASFGLYFAFPLLLGGASTIAAAEVFRLAGWVCAVPSLVLSYFSAGQYVPLGMKALREARSK